jgi:enoyl-CoA hydratase
MTVRLQKIGAVAVLSLDRPATHNAYNTAMRDALYGALLAVRDDPEVRSLVLRGNGPSFCSGGDVAEFGTAPSPYAARRTRWRRDVWGALRALPKPTIAAVHGYAVGGGFEMAMLCDVCIAASEARFALPETGLAMIPGVAGTQTLSRLLGIGVASDLILSGRWLDARQAQRLGLVSRVVAAARLQAVALREAKRLARLPAALLAAVKRAVDEGLDLLLADGLALERRLNDMIARAPVCLSGENLRVP